MGCEEAVRLDQFFANLRNRADSVRKVTALAFSQARYKISALVFGVINQERIRLAYTQREGRKCCLTVGNCTEAIGLRLVIEKLGGQRFQAPS